MVECHTKIWMSVMTKILLLNLLGRTSQSCEYLLAQQKVRRPKVTEAQDGACLEYLTAVSVSAPASPSHHHLVREGRSVVMLSVQGLGQIQTLD
jgi:hypothetical protein